MSAGEMFDGTSTVVLYDELALDASLPFAWRPSAESLSLGQSRHVETNLRVLQACLALDDQTSGDKGDDPAPQAADLARLEMKVNLLLDMVGRLLVQTQPRPQPLPLRFNARGASWKGQNVSTTAVSVGDKGVFEIYIHDSLVDPLRVLGRVMRSTQDGTVEVQFDRSSDAIVNLIDKLVFRRHRRRIADVRNPKRN